MFFFSSVYSVFTEKIVKKLIKNSKNFTGILCVCRAGLTVDVRSDRGCAFAGISLLCKKSSTCGIIFQNRKTLKKNAKMVEK